MFWFVLGLVVLVAAGVARWKLGSKSYVEGEDASKGRVVPNFVFTSAYAFGALLMVWGVISTSVIWVPSNQIAVLSRIYRCEPISGGRNVALDGECGRQARVLMPGFQSSFLINVLNNIEYVDMVVVPDGSYVNLSAKDGIQPEPGQVASKPWPLGTNEYAKADGTKVKGNMLDAVFFLESALGHKGPQATILQPGTYVVNPYLWDLGRTSVVSSDDNAGDGTEQIRRAVQARVEIDTGEVGVIKSAIDEDLIPDFAPGAGTPARCGKNAEVVKDLGQIKAILVAPGCRGVWRVVLPPGKYYINEDLYQVTKVDTRIQNWTYGGGYTRRIIDLHVKDDGSIEQTPSQEEIVKPDNAAGEAVNVTVEGWQVYQEVRLQARVSPEQAPLVVAAVGDLKQVEERIIGPQVRSVLRNIGGSRITVGNTVAYEEATAELDALKARLELLRAADGDMADGLNAEQRATEIASLDKKIKDYQLPDPTQTVTRTTRAIDFQSERETLEKMVATAIQKLGQETGIEIVQVAFGKTDLPPELLVARKVEQLAVQQKNALIQQRIAQVQRQATEAAKARADKQGELVQAEINVEVSKKKIDTRTNEGEAEKKFSQLQAEGRKAEVAVLGEDRVFIANLFKDALATLATNPKILTDLKLPSTMVVGQSSSLEGMAAVFKGAVDQTKTEPAPQ